MTSKTSNQSRPINFDVNPSPETRFHLPMSPSEPGKFDFYRVHLANHHCHTDSMSSDCCDAPTLETSLSSNRRWTPFATVVPSDQSKSSTVSSNSQTMFSKDLNLSSNTTNKPNEPIQSVGSFSSLTDAVKNAMQKGHFSASGARQTTFGGTTLSTKDLNHLSPQSM